MGETIDELIRRVAFAVESCDDFGIHIRDSLEQLEAGKLDIVCSVDMFNEGIDLPKVDTVMMLRPTESRILFLQQFGRGLRISPDKNRLTVIDYIGNYRSFLTKPRAAAGHRRNGC